MLIKYAFLVISLSMSISSVAASEANSASSTNQSSTTIPQTNQPSPSQKKDSSQSAGENKSPVQTQSGTDKKPSMADFCRKHTC